MKGANSSEVVAWLLERMFRVEQGWEHPTFLSLLAGVTVQHARWRPAPGRRCIWEYVRHMLQWQTFVKVCLQGRPAPETYEPWPPLPEERDDDELARLWSADVERVKAVHAEFITAVKALDPTEAHPHPDLSHLPHWIAAVGVQMHDSYHLGQIALLRGMQGLPAVE